MKYIKPTDFLSVREFKAEYQRIEESITELLAEDASARTADELNKRLQSALNAAVKYLSSVNAEFAKKELATAFNEGKESSAKEAETEKPKLTVAQANEILEKQGYKYSKTAFTQDLYIELQTATDSAGKGLKTRVNGIIEQLRKDGKDSVYNVQEAIKKDLQENGLLVVEYANGAKQTLATYASMAARSARIETTNIGAIGRALQAGTDLVRMTSMPQCCKYCGAFQDKVYSISGKDKRFPALFKTVLRSGYALPHPNCRHEFIPYFEEMEAPEDVERMAKQSRIKYDKQGNLVDVRSQADIRSYQAWQAGNRQRNAELREYERMRAFYAGKDKEAPYATLSAFRRARRAQSKNYLESRKEWYRTTEEKNSFMVVEKRLTLWAISGKLGKEPNPNAKVDCAVDWKSINNKKYHDALIRFAGSRNVGLSIVKIGKEMLKHREGTEHEDLYLLDARTGMIVDKNLKSTALLAVKKTDKMDEVLRRNDGKEYILVHNHPYSSAPSVEDINSLYKHQKIKYGLIIGHDGTIYKYTKPKKEIEESILTALRKKAYEEKKDFLEAKKVAYKNLAKMEGFSLEEYDGT